MFAFVLPLSLELNTETRAILVYGRVVIGHLGAQAVLGLAPAHAVAGLGSCIPRAPSLFKSAVWLSLLREKAT